jgi:succinyl-CoA--D-citramalate CoA-transferase
VIICAGNHPTWVRLCATIGRDDLLADPRYATQALRVQNVDALEAEISAWTRARTVADVEATLSTSTIPAGSVLPLHDVLRHPQFAVRGLGGAGGPSGGVFHLDREPLDARPAPAQPGAGTRAILLERCGVRPVEYERWLAAGIVREAQEKADAKAA